MLKNLVVNLYEKTFSGVSVLKNGSKWNLKKKKKKKKKKKNKDSSEWDLETQYFTETLIL